jgi:hypothetical protein
MIVNAFSSDFGIIFQRAIFTLIHALLFVALSPIPPISSAARPPSPRPRRRRCVACRLTNSCAMRTTPILSRATMTTEAKTSQNMKISPNQPLHRLDTHSHRATWARGDRFNLADRESALAKFETPYLIVLLVSSSDIFVLA